MPINPRLVPRKPRDPGAARVSVDHERRLRSLENQAGVVGAGTTITGPTIQTADSGQRVYMQGPLGGNPGGVGLFCTDPSGNVAVSLRPGIGLTLATGGGAWNNIDWRTGSFLDGSVNVNASGSANIMSLVANPGSGAAGYAALLLTGDTSGGSYISAFTNNGTTSLNAVILNPSGYGVWPKGIGMWGVIPPSPQPATPSTLAGVIAILQSYGMCS